MMETSTLSLSVVIPCYNEERYIRGTVEEILQVFTGEKTEIVIVNDGSHDHSGTVLAELAKQYDCVRILTHGVNKGKGAAIRTGVLAAKGEVIACIDGDGEVDASALLPALDLLCTSNFIDIIVGNRYLIPGSYKTTLKRRLSSQCYRLFVKLLFRISCSDTQAVFKLYRNQIAHDLFSSSNVDGYAFDIDILAQAGLRYLHVEEYPIAQILKGKSTITKRNILHMILDTCITYRRYRAAQWKDLSAHKNVSALLTFVASQFIAAPVSASFNIGARISLLCIK